MLVTYTHSRAAILCLGGWGLQVLLHLTPRFLATQEQRAALHAAGPDLNRITSFGAVLPEPLLPGDGQAQLYLRRPRDGAPWTPYYVERLLLELARREPTPGEERAAALLTASERRASALLRMAEPMLEPMGYEGYEFRAPATGLPGLGLRVGAQATGLRRATRSDIFTAGLTHADYAARLLETYVLDPIRQDNLAPDDPFVQTTLYVVAPLFEPLTSALIWPLVGGLMARLGRRHISNVVGLFATGSYATDLTRGIEDAAAYSALQELEVLTGIRRDEARRAALAAQVRSIRPALAEYIGEHIFDRIYLLDREKSNQGLAQDSHELAVLAGNALEALVVGSGDLFIQEQLGFAVHAGEERPYSLIGAAADYVPVNQILHAVNRTEESRLVREWVLRNTPDEPQPNPLARLIDRQPGPTLAEMGFSQAKALAQLAARMPELYAGEPEELAALSVRESFVFPAAAAHELRRLPPVEWAAAFDEHLAQVRSTFNLAVGSAAADEAWGLATSGSAAEAATGATLGFAAGLEADDRIYPQLLMKMHKRLVDLLAGSPTGLMRAAEQTQRWLHEAEEALQKLQTFSTPSTRQLARIQQGLALREWAVRNREMAAKQPSLLAILLRAAVATGLVGLFSLIYLLFAGRAWNPAEDGWALGGFATGIVLAGLATYRIHRNRQRSARRARIALAQAELTRELQNAAHDGLTRAYTQLAAVLRSWHAMLREAMDELHHLSTPPEMPAVPPPEIPQSYLYQPHLNQPLWDRCLTYLRKHMDVEGQRSEERLDKLWGTAKWRNQMQRILRTAPAAPGAHAGRSQARTIAEFIRQTVRESVAPVTLQEANPIRDNLIRALATEFSIEHLLWRGAAEAQDIERRLRAMEMGLADSRTVAPGAQTQTPTNRRYVEAAWNRAKPTGNYDVADRLAVYGVTIDFAAASGSADSDLTRSLLEEFNITLLPTENPFTLIFVRTVHGLTLDDLDCMRRYQAEQRSLAPDERALIHLAPNLDNIPASRHNGAERTTQHQP
ncbi:MAG TPA: hypothetical protein VNK95_19470 [Caldilineaceae bacterium]|nr:hypothetical protein [Caldilineaceae bacterium]